MFLIHSYTSYALIFKKTAAVLKRRSNYAVVSHFTYCTKLGVMLFAGPKKYSAAFFFFTRKISRRCMTHIKLPRFLTTTGYSILNIVY
jgi:hypothetical protein